MVWRNPIIRRYARSRLRAKGLGLSALIVGLLAAFLFASTRQVAMYQFGVDTVSAERAPLIWLLILQGGILFLMAAGQVSGGMTTEKDEGVIDYQRLAPMTPLGKVIGYLFGLPIREYVLFLVTMPFTLWCLWRGEVPLKVSLQLYGVFLTSAMLYHVTGVVAGTVVKNRRWAFLIAMGAVFLLYTVVPQVAKFGLVYFKYLTIYPTVEELLPHLVPREIGAVAETAQRLAPSAKFFGLDLPQSLFTMVSQGVLIFMGVMMLWRWWRRNESHLLGKVGATGFFAWVQVVLLGNALPLIDSGQVFPSRELDRRFGRAFRERFHWQPEEDEVVFMVGVYGMVTLCLIWLLTLVISPNEDRLIRGWRRTRKLGKRRLSLISDPASSFPWVALMAVMGAAGWFLFARGIVESRWFPGYDLPGQAALVFGLVLLVAGLGFQAILEGLGKKQMVLSAIFVGVVPLMVGFVVMASSGEAYAATVCWLAGISPLSWPMYATMVEVPMGDVPLSLVKALPRAFWFWMGLGVVVTIWLIGKLWKARRRVEKMVEG